MSGQWVVIFDHTANGGELEAFGPYRSRDKAYVVWKRLEAILDRDGIDSVQSQIARLQDAAEAAAS